MTIEEMHVTFRELAQQMGQETVRAIFSEDIDICLNAAIITKVKSILQSNIGTVFKDKISRQNSSISPINALRTLYKFNDIDDITGSGTEVNPFIININTDDIMLFTGFAVSYDKNTLYDCRIIEAEKLAQTLHDFCNRASKSAPIVTAFDNNSNIKINLYIGKKNTNKPTLFRYYYISEPVKVHYDEDSPENNINCNLPDYLHMEIIEYAVNYYLRSVGAVSGNNTNPN